MKRFFIGAMVVLSTLILFSCPDERADDPIPGDADIVVVFDVKSPGHKIADTLWGIFYEDINFGADGGMYPELVMNRSFEDRENTRSNLTINRRPTQYWTVSGTGNFEGAAVSPIDPANPYYAAVNVTTSGYSLINRGFTTGDSPAMYISSGEQYDFLFYFRNGTFTGDIVCDIVNASGNVMANTITVTPNSSSWQKFGPEKFNAASSGSGQLRLRFNGSGTIDIDFVSLMPVNTHGYGQKAWPHGGLRKDLVDALRDLNPGFIRFPGGCIVEGAWRHDNHYQWKDTIGTPEKRKENYNLWGYMQTYGLGFHEFFQLCKDLGAEPVPVLYAGLVCQGGRRDTGHTFEADLAPGSPEMAALVQDYLDLIEYANGSTATTWGAKRAANGSPEPFNIKKIGIGNENWDDSATGANYFRNYGYIRAEIEKVYPDIDFITSTGPLSDLSHPINKGAWNSITGNEKFKTDIVDEHYYNPPEWFSDFTNILRYVNPGNPARSNKIRIFVGEYAAHDTGRARTWRAALSEAAYMTGLERNSDIVVMASYAPLFGRDGMTQWNPNMIYFNAEKITNLTPSYHVQKLYGNNTGKYILKPAEEPSVRSNFFQSSSIDGKNIYTKLVNTGNVERVVFLQYKNADISSANLTTLSAALSSATVQTATSPAKYGNTGVTVRVPGNSLMLVCVNLK